VNTGRGTRQALHSGKFELPPIGRPGSRPDRLCITVIQRLVVTRDRTSSRHFPKRRELGSCDVPEEDRGAIVQSQHRVIAPIRSLG